MPGKATPTGREIRPLNILVVDDDQQVLMAIADLLKADGHRVATFADSESALKAMVAGEFDLLITDLGLPGLSGLQLAQVVSFDYPLTRIVLVTGLKPEVTPEELKECGVAAIIHKPFTLHDLYSQIEQVF